MVTSRAAAVDATAQIIVAHTLDNNGSDQAQFAPLLDGIKANLKRNPDEVSADAGYCSAANLARSAGGRSTATSPPHDRSTAASPQLQSGRLCPARSSPE